MFPAIHRGLHITIHEGECWLDSDPQNKFTKLSDLVKYVDANIRTLHPETEGKPPRQQSTIVYLK